MKNIENIMLPSQLVAVIADPLLQKLLLLRPDEEAFVRVNNWMMAVLQDIRSGEADAHTISEVLGLLREYVAISKVGANKVPFILERRYCETNTHACSKFRLLC